MAKSKNHRAHNQSRKAHRNGIKKPRKQRRSSTRGMDPKFLRNHKYARQYSSATKLSISRFSSNNKHFSHHLYLIGPHGDKYFDEINGGFAWRDNHDLFHSHMEEDIHSRDGKKSAALFFMLYANAVTAVFEITPVELKRWWFC